MEPVYEEAVAARFRFPWNEATNRRKSRTNSIPIDEIEIKLNPVLNGVFYKELLLAAKLLLQMLSTDCAGHDMPPNM